MDASAWRPRVFISYAHEDPHHIEHVRTLVSYLLNSNIDVRLDIDRAIPRKAWPAWLRDEIANADCIVVIASPDYRIAADDTAPSDGNRSTHTEASLLRELLHQGNPAWPPRMLTVVLPGYSISDVPNFLLPGSGRRDAPPLLMMSTVNGSYVRALVSHISLRDDRAEQELHSTDEQPQDMDEPDAQLVDHASGVGTLVGTWVVPVSIYLGDGTGHDAVENAVVNALEASGLVLLDGEDPIVGSWFRRLRAKAAEFERSELGATAAHAAEIHLVTARDAEVTARLMEHLAPVIESLRPERNTALRIGALLIVKVEGELTVLQLTPAQQYRLNHEPHLVQQPRALLHALATRQDHRAEPAPPTELPDAPSLPEPTSAETE